MPRRALALLNAGLLLALACPAATLPASAAGNELATLYAAPVPTASASLNVTAVFAGFSLTGPERTALLSQVDTIWWPVITSLGLPLGVNYTVTLRTVEASPQFTEALSAFLNDSFSNDTLSRVIGNYIGLFQNVSAAFPAWTESTPVRHADAAAAAAWLAAADGEFPEVASASGEARLFFLNPAPIAEPYYYAVSSFDRDRLADFTYEMANAWGDGSGVFFQDLRALPSHLGESSDGGRPGNFAGMPPYWSYGASPPERLRLTTDLASYIDTSVKVLVAPSFGLIPFQAASVTFNVTLFDRTASQSLFEAAGVGAPFGIDSPADILDAALVEGALNGLTPYTRVTARIAVANNASDPETAAAIEAASRTHSGATIVNPFTLSEELRDRWNVPSLPVEPGATVTIPAILAVYDGTTWVDNENIRGVTLQRSDGRAAGIVIAAGLPQLAARGFSETLIHESGHAFGFGHPHEVPYILPNGTRGVAVDWLRTLSSTPMTYLPEYVDYSFDSFDRHALWVGVAAATLGAAYQVRLAAYQRLDALGYGPSNLPQAVVASEALFAGFANGTRSLLEGGVLYIEADPPFSEGGALVMAKRAYDEARDLGVRAAFALPCCDLDRPGFLPGLGLLAVLGAIAAGAAAATPGWKVRRRR